MTTKEAALYLGLKVRTFWRVAAPHLTPRRYSLRSIRWPIAQLDAFKQSVTHETVSKRDVARRRKSYPPGLADLMAKHGCVG